MTQMNNPDEQRKHSRLQARDGAFVLLGPDSTKLGRIIDISIGGLAFSHMARTRPSEDLVELDLFLIDTDYYLSEVPFLTVWDVKTHENPFSSITMRRCGVQFGDLNSSQRTELNNFIQNHTVG
ncbi:MAG: PilZ domain-containing protein [Deltaproteobacteria bacterium]|nr:PilZ domain-containing protein [Deltaproteobacteria bacterium]